MHDLLCGIDPDSKESGLAVWNVKRQEFDTITQLPFWDLIDYIETLRENYKICIYVEASWQIKKSNWHSKRGQSKYVGEKIAKCVGSNHQVGRLLVEYCLSSYLDCVEVLPKGKLDAKSFKQLTGVTTRTNSEKRDAAYLVYGIK